MKLIYVSNNASDHVLLIESNEVVVSAWAVTPQVMRDFCDCSQHPDDWQGHGMSDSVGDYGDVVAERVGHVLTAGNPALWTDRVERHLIYV